MIDERDRVHGAGRWVDECASTNDLAREAALSGAGHGAWIAARRQTAGRGRRGRSWLSPEGGLYFSMVTRIEAAPLTWVPLAAGVAAARAIERTTPVRISLKWPNDLFVGHAKLGGILCEAGAGFQVVGIGVNCRFSPRIPERPATSLREECGAPLEPEGLADVLAPELVGACSRLKRDWREIRDEFLGRCLYPRGSVIRWGENGDLEGEFQGLGESGELIVRAHAEATEVRLYAEDLAWPRDGRDPSRDSV